MNFVEDVSIFSKHNANVVILKDFHFLSDSTNFVIAYVIEQIIAVELITCFVFTEFFVNICSCTILLTVKDI